MPPEYQVPMKYWYNYVRGRLEEEMKLLQFLVVKGRGVAIDIGGNRGVYAYHLDRLGTRVEVFEPNPTCLRVLNAWASAKSSVSIHSEALSSHEGETVLHIPVDQAGVEHDALASIENDGFAQVRDVRVTVRRLDSYGFEEVTFIKIDVEGHEFSVIDGARRTLKSSRPALLVEIEQRHSAQPIVQVFDLIESLGYLGFFLVNGRVTPLKIFQADFHQSRANGDHKYVNNFIFLHSERIKNHEYEKIPHIADVSEVI